nr:hypothetical protein BaRGS_017603 [Batillaria attramentaria]
MTTVQSEIRKTWQRFRLTHQSDFRSSCRLRSNCNTLTSYMSRTRESVGSLHVQDMRGKADGRACSYPLVEATPMDCVSDAAERQPLANGKVAHFHCFEQQPIMSNGSREQHGADGGSREDLAVGHSDSQYD